MRPNRMIPPHSQNHPGTGVHLKELGIYKPKQPITTGPPRQRKKGTAIGAAPQGLLITKYPGAIDSAPTITDDTTPLSGIFHNYLGLLLEAVMAEVGPNADIPKHHTNLLKFLGMEAANRISNWRSRAKASGGDEKGQIFGLLKYHASQQSSNYNNDTSVTVTSFQGSHPSTTRKPLALACADAAGISNANMIAGVGGGVRAGVTAIGSSGGNPTFTFAYRGSPAGTGTPAGTFTQHADIMLFFLHESF